MVLRISDGFTGSGEVDVLRDPLASKAFQIEATRHITSAEPGLVRVHFAPTIAGTYATSIKVRVRWSDGQEMVAETDVSAGATPAQSPRDQAFDRLAGPRGYRADRAGIVHAYNDVRTHLNSVMNERKQGNADLLSFMKEEDPPSLTDKIVQALAVAALGYVTGGVAAYLGAQLTYQFSAAIVSAISTAIEDGAKEVIPLVRSEVSKNNAAKGGSLASFTSSISSALERQRTLLELAVNKQEAASARAHDEADDIPSKGVAAKSGILDAAEYNVSLNKTSPDPKADQYRVSFAEWMTGLAQNDRGRLKDGTTDVSGATDLTPYAAKYMEEAPTGFVTLNFGRWEHGRPVKVAPSAVTVRGATTKALKPLATTPLRNLRMPIVATGYLYDGTLDGFHIDDNQVTIAKSESGNIRWEGRDDGLRRMKEITSSATETIAAEKLFEDDFANITLAGATT